MGHANKICLEMQAKKIFEGMKAFGESKDDVKKAAGDEWHRLNLQSQGISKRDYVNDALRNKIFSVGTYLDYAAKNNRFFNYCRERGYVDSKHWRLRDIKQYIPEFLQNHIEEGHSAWTVKSHAAALAKLYHERGQDYMRELKNMPSRNREDITRSRGTAKRDYGFSHEKNKEIINFARSTGLRNNRELKQLKGNQLHFSPKGQPFIGIVGKGGKYREIPIIGQYKNDIVERMQVAGDNKVWERVPSHMDVHGYRADYANALYNAIARPIDQIPFDTINKGTGRPYQSEVYHCRGDKKGVCYDKRAMEIVSKALGHDRIGVIAEHYLW